MKQNRKFDKRKYTIAGGLMLLVLIYAIRLFNLQILSDEYKAYADSNAFFRKTIYPSRGMIYDRNDKLLVYNQPAYDLMLVMREVDDFDTLSLCNILDITIEDFRKRITDIKNKRLNPGYSSYTPQTFISQLSTEEYGLVQEKLYSFPGFFVQNRTIRQYEYLTAPHILGNVREVSRTDITNDPFYRQGDYTGDMGVEKAYEKYLRGEKGVEILLRDAHGRIKGKYHNGLYDEKPQKGRDLKLTIDVDLQQYAESLMVDKIGAVVAIEPKTGEILAMVSAPTFDPSRLVGRARGSNYLELTRDELRPLYDRAISASYPPGSTFKVAQGLMFLEDGAMTEHTPVSCHNGYVVGRFKLGCHPHSSPITLGPALATSCNAYFCAGFRRMLDNREKYPTILDGMNKWRDYMVSMGFGYKLGIDLPSESRGFIPNANYYSNVFGTSRWRSLNVVSISIGQGEVLSTPLQIANLGASIANKGFFVTPHVVKSIEDTLLQKDYIDRHYTMVDSKHYDIMVESMREAVLNGTCRIGAIEGIEICGKTGTAQNPHGRDHSVFMGFAPKEDPEIAIAVYVENAGFGATYGVPIGSLVIEKYLNDTISTSRKWLEDRMLTSSTLKFR